MIASRQTSGASVVQAYLTGDEPTARPSAATLAPVRLGYFANLTHAQAILGISRGDFQKALGSVPLDTKVFNAGPSVVEAFFADA